MKVDPDKTSHSWWYWVTTSLQKQADGRANAIHTKAAKDYDPHYQDFEDLRRWFFSSVLAAYWMHRPNGPEEGEVIPNTVRTALFLESTDSSS